MKENIGGSTSAYDLRGGHGPAVPVEES